MVFIIEGVDGAGKSTVIKHLKEAFPEAVFVRESYPGKSADVRYDRFDQLKDNIISSTKTYIYDRATALDDFIYNPVIEDKESCLDWKDVFPALAQCKIIFLDCNTTVLRGRVDDRGDMYVTANANLLDAIATKYHEMLDTLPNVTKINVTEMTEEQEWMAVADCILESMNCYQKKRQKIAHILPKKLLELTAVNQYHMSLAHLIIQDKEYADFYRRMVATGRYVLMDNGAAEGSQLSNDDLLKCWKLVHPTELVLPDTLCNSAETLAKVNEAIPFFRGNGVTCKFMAVPQGETLEEWKNCAFELLLCPEIHCIGVSKFLTIKTKDPDVRYKAVQYLDEKIKGLGRKDIEVHLLGCDAGPSEVGKIFSEFDFVRGCDTALAYIYASAGKAMEENSARPSGEINFLNGGIDAEDALLISMQNFDRIARVINKSGDYTWF